MSQTFCLIDACDVKAYGFDMLQNNVFLRCKLRYAQVGKVVGEAGSVANEAIKASKPFVDAATPVVKKAADQALSAAKPVSLYTLIAHPQTQYNIPSLPTLSVTGFRFSP